MSIFDLSKILMYKFHFDYIKKKINMVTTQEYYSQIFYFFLIYLTWLVVNIA